MRRYLEKLQSKGIYTFTREELKNNLSISDAGVNANISRYLKKGDIVKLKRGFYTIVPPEYKRPGVLPPYWFIDDLMKYMITGYYVGLASAASIYGVSHQQPQVFQIISEKQIKDIQVKNLKIEFIFKSKLEPEVYISEKKTETGTVKLSGVELTCFDMVRYISRAGGINSVATILEELCSEISSEKLVELADLYNKPIYVQRLGYIFDKGGFDKLGNELYQWFEQKDSYPVYLVPAKERKSLRLNRKWNVLVNKEVEPDII